MAEHPPGGRRDAALHHRLEAAYAARGADYRPRTRQMDGGRARYVNRLIEEASPYLLQHAHNPVDWRPWGPETLAEAAALDRPVFLSVGYATCHWCHVMEEESFDDEDVAEALNSAFIPVKIDREQNPDLDHVYITATQLQHQHAGWPNSLWLTPEGKPFHTGTYFPKAQFLETLAAVSAAWTSAEGRREIAEVSTRLAAAVQRLTAMRTEGEVALDAALHAKAAQQILGMANPAEGGFSTSQQFPQEGFLLYLLDHWRRTGQPGALSVATKTLDAIAAGGIHDQVGGGFHRYTVDPNWRTPHFEKMLYNQGLLARAFVEGWEITGNPAWRRAARRCFAYVARDMTDPAGACYAAEDADSPDLQGKLEEGAFYAWTPADAEAAAGDPAIVATLGLDRRPTIPAGAVPHLAPGAEIDFAALDPLLERLREARDRRRRPLRDDKVIAGWNGLMIRALADGAAAFDAPEYARQAARAGEAVWSRLWDGTKLARLWAGGHAREDGALEDYAWLALGYLALADATGEAVWRDRALALAEAIETRFADGTGRLKMAARDGPLGPVYDSADGATPSGESSALDLLARLSRRGAGPGIEARALKLRAALSPVLAETPLLRPDALAAARILAGGESGWRGRRRVGWRVWPAPHTGAGRRPGDPALRAPDSRHRPRLARHRARRRRRAGPRLARRRRCRLARGPSRHPRLRRHARRRGRLRRPGRHPADRPRDPAHPPPASMLRPPLPGARDRHIPVALTPRARQDSSA